VLRKNQLFAGEFSPALTTADQRLLPGEALACGLGFSISVTMLVMSMRGSMYMGSIGPEVNFRWTLIGL
jgi:hypothetical protein